ncbi:MAG: c-type cytochrome [Blastocatellia bacterium]
MKITIKGDTATRRHGDAAWEGQRDKPLLLPRVAASPRRRVVFSHIAVSPRRRVAVSFLAIAFCLLPFALARVSAHEPITTKVRFNKEVIHILQRSCLGCHHPGGIAMSLATYDEARPWAKAIKEEVLNKRMPPWHAVKGFGEFRNAPPLTQREIDLLVNWVEGGAPKGEDSDLPTAPLYSDDWRLGKPDLILKPQAAAAIATDADDTRTITLATNATEARWLAAIDLRPSDARVVHCAKFYLVGGRGPGTGDRANTDSTNNINNSQSSITEAEGNSSLANTGPRPPAPGPCLGTWMPGQKTVAWPEGTAQLLPAGVRIAVEIHYCGTAEAARDESEVGLYFAKVAPRRQVQEIAVTDGDARIPAGAARHPINVSYTTQEDVEALALRPAVHPLITSLQVTAYRPDGSEEVLLWTRDYQFDWQPTYYLKRAAALPKGTRIDVIAYFDNSDSNRNNPNDPPKALRLRDLTDEPLCAVAIIKPER